MSLPLWALPLAQVASPYAGVRWSNPVPGALIGAMATEARAGGDRATGAEAGDMARAVLESLSQATMPTLDP